MSLTKKMFKTCMVAVTLGLSALSAQANWTFTADILDPYTNPEDGLNQGNGIDDWLKGLYNLSSLPTLTADGNVSFSAQNPYLYTPQAVDGSILTLHYGGGNPYTGTGYPVSGPTTFAYVCSGSDCSVFNYLLYPPSNDNPLSNYRLWNGDPNKTPEPTTAALIGLGLLGMAAIRRRKQA